MSEQKKIRIPFNYTPRSYQLPLLKAIDSGIKRAVWVTHRRSGKDKTCINLIIKKMLERVGVYYYIFPTYSQANKVIWNGIDGQGMRFLDHFPPELIDGKPNDTEMRIKLRNGSLFQMIGSDNVDSIVGTNPVGVVFSEYALQDPTAWGFIRPILAENGGWAVFVGTVRGENHFYDIYEMARNDPKNWFCRMDKASETMVIPQDILDQERQEIVRLYGTDALYMQEYECNFSVPISGAYYADNIGKAYRDGRIGHVPHEERLSVDTWWDLGINDKMAIWFTQSVGQEIRAIDYYEGSGQGLPHYIQKIKEKGYIFGRHTAPHDIEVRELTNGRSRRDTARDLGIDFHVCPKLLVIDGIEAVRGIFPRMWFDKEKCKEGLNALKNYRKTFDEKRKTYSNTPYHDWSSNGCFTADTEILTRYGIHRIIDLPKTGEVLTPCGWKTYENPRITKRNANLVEVRFKGGYTVRCTPDHLFLTETGWKSAESLEPGSSVQSALTPLRGISMAVYTGLGRARDTIREVVDYSTETFGGMLLGLFQKVRTYTTGTGTLTTIPLKISNVSLRVSTLAKKWQTDISAGYFQSSMIKPETRPPLGTSLMLGDFGTDGMRNVKRHGQNGRELKNLVCFVASSLWRWLDKGRSIKSIAPKFAKLRIIENVVTLTENADVWDLTVPDGHCFSLKNGAVVHNSDAFRTMAQAIELDYKSPEAKPDRYSLSYTRKSNGPPAYAGILG